MVQMFKTHILIMHRRGIYSNVLLFRTSIKLPSTELRNETIPFNHTTTHLPQALHVLERGRFKNWPLSLRSRPQWSRLSLLLSPVPPPLPCLSRWWWGEVSPLPSCSGSMVTTGGMGWTPIGGGWSISMGGGGGGTDILGGRGGSDLTTAGVGGGGGAGFSVVNSRNICWLTGVLTN